MATPTNDLGNFFKQLFGGMGGTDGSNPFASFFQTLMKIFGGTPEPDEAQKGLGGKEAIKNLQKDLAEQGLYPAKGAYAQDGIAGEVTRHALQLRDDPDFAATYMQTALDKKKLSTNDIMKIQASLNKLGYDVGDVNGRMNNETREDIARYLKDNPKTPQTPAVTESVAPLTGVKHAISGIAESLKNTRDTVLAPPSATASFGTSALLSLIGHHESKQNYNAIWPKSAGNGTEFTKMTVNEVLAYQDKYVADGAKSSAVGRYQIIRDTMRGLVKDMKLNGNETFDEKMQDRMATRLLEQRGLNAYRDGRITEGQFMNRIAKEWASMPKTNGKGHYDGDGLNKVGVSTAPVLAAIREIRATPQEAAPVQVAAAATVTAKAAAPEQKPADIDFSRPAENRGEGMEGAAKRLGIDNAFSSAGNLLTKAGEALGLTEKDPQASLASRTSQIGGMAPG